MDTGATRNLIVRALHQGADLRLQLAHQCMNTLVEAAEAIHGTLQGGGKIWLFGNGGSAADAQHLAAKFGGRFSRDRNPLPAIALTTNTSTLTAIGNDYGFEMIFARQLEALGSPGDVALAISTSGRSANVVAAVEVARGRGLTSVALTGGDGGLVTDIADISIVVP